MRACLLAMPLILLATYAAAQDRAGQRPALQDCSVVQSEGLGPDEASIGLALTGDGPDRHVVAAQPRAGQAPAPEVVMQAMRQGVSYGAALAPPAGQAEPEAAFTLATVEQAGTVLLETWRWRATTPGSPPPRYAWARLRCGP
ncbi:hypothetical protein [Falsiroseomonas oryzae]|uniref:hypothetical protein n=1 Tax=Falsiroseomonas oryzae TaxID=2766473 RepID=UPI0022EB4609|nr:hypothetical protein [Roseomonas sp. MO-31]